VVIVAALTAMGLAVVHLRARATRMGYELAQEQGRQQQLLEERARLRYDLGRLRTPERMIEQAERLNLAPTPPGTASPPGGGPAARRAALPRRPPRSPEQ
jgi:hypothetical protein